MSFPLGTMAGFVGVVGNRAMQNTPQSSVAAEEDRCCAQWGVAADLGTLGTGTVARAIIVDIPYHPLSGTKSPLRVSTALAWVL